MIIEHGITPEVSQLMGHSLLIRKRRNWGNESICMMEDDDAYDDEDDVGNDYDYRALDDHGDDDNDDSKDGC